MEYQVDLINEIAFLRVIKDLSFDMELCGLDVGNGGVERSMIHSQLLSEFPWKVFPLFSSISPKLSPEIHPRNFILVEI